MDEGITFNGHNTLSLLGYSDSDWGGCKINRKSNWRIYLYDGRRTVKLEIEKSKDISLYSYPKQNIWL